MCLTGDGSWSPFTFHPVAVPPPFPSPTPLQLSAAPLYLLKPRPLNKFGQFWGSASSVSPSRPRSAAWWQQRAAAARRSGTARPGACPAKKLLGSPKPAPTPPSAAPGPSVRPAPSPFSWIFCFSPSFNFFCTFSAPGFCAPSLARDPPSSRVSDPTAVGWPHGNQQPQHGDWI